VKLEEETSMSIITKIGFVCYDTPNIERLADYYEQILGFRTRREGDLYYCHGMSGEVEVVLRRSGQSGCTTLGLQVCDEHVLHRLKQELRENYREGTEKPLVEFGLEKAISVQNVFGIEIVLYAKAAWARKEPLSASAAILPVKLGHAAFNVVDPKACVAFFTDVLGFKVSDWMGDFFAFLRCNADHHAVNFLRGDKAKNHHVAFELRDWCHVQQACDHLARNKLKLIWGPGRHGIGHNIFTYHYDPDGNIIELFTELDRIASEDLGYFEPRPWHSDNPQLPRVWTPEEASNLWGDPAPAGFRK
jgi:catechol 2,3-dioxygenase-like lactoylglutathione lyase family enzyme